MDPSLISWFCPHIMQHALIVTVQPAILHHQDAGYSNHFCDACSVLLLTRLGQK